MLRLLQMKPLRVPGKILSHFSLGLIFFLIVSINPQTVQSQTYVSVFGGLNLTTESDVTDKFPVAGVEATARGSIETDNGYVAGLTIGKKFDNISLELELSYRENDLDELTFDSISALGTTIAVNLGDVPIEGTHSSRSAMINGWFDLPMNSVTPYVGGGVGISNVNLEVDSISGATTNFDESDTVFAFQGGAGIKFSISDNASLDLGYRFFAAHDPVHDDGVDEIEVDYQNHSAMVRLIFHL